MEIIATQKGKGYSYQAFHTKSAAIAFVPLNFVRVLWNGLKAEMPNDEKLERYAAYTLTKHGYTFAPLRFAISSENTAPQVIHTRMVQWPYQSKIAASGPPPRLIKESVMHSPDWCYYI